MEDFAEKVKGNLAEADWAMRRDLIRMLVKRVEIAKEEVRVVFRTLPDPIQDENREKSLLHCRRRIDLRFGNSVNPPTFARHLELAVDPQAL